MASHPVRRHPQVGPFIGALSAALACSAPPAAEDDDDGVPAFSGALPSANGSVLPAQQGAGASTLPPSGVGTPNNEAVGGNPAGIPVSGGSSGGNQTPAASGGSAGPTPMQGAAGSAATTPEQGAAGGGMGGASGAANAGNAGGGNDSPTEEPPQAPPALGANCAPGGLFCEDFEALPVGPLSGTVNGMRIERTVDIIDEPGRGRVLRVQAGTTYDNKAGFFLDDFTPPNNSLFGRAFIRVQQFPVNGGDHWVLFEATQAAGGGEQARPVGGQFSRWAPGSDGPSALDWTDWQQSNVATNAGVYECVEWQIDGANGGNDMLLWVNGTEIRPQDRGNFRLPPIGRLWFGFVVYQNGEPQMHDVRFDDVVLSTERVGCN